MKLIKLVILITLISFSAASARDKNIKDKKHPAQTSSKVQLGAYYYDGWNGVTNTMITPALKDSFSNREPVWGWVANDQKTMDQQITLAANAGLSFFSFCWYYPVNWDKTFQNHPLNHALKLFTKSSAKSKLKFNLMVANQNGFYIRPKDWDAVTDAWVALFKDDAYLKVNGKPLITFFSLDALVDKFQSTASVKAALNTLRTKSIKAGLNGVTIAVNVPNADKSVQIAEACGFDVLTGYNYQATGYLNASRSLAKTSTQRVFPISTLQSGEKEVWSKIVQNTNLKFIPAITLNWDPRPWASLNKGYSKSRYYSGFGKNSAFTSVKNCVAWMNANQSHITQEKLAVVYAWNELGEGAYLTPTKGGEDILGGVTNALQ